MPCIEACKRLAFAHFLRGRRALSQYLEKRKSLDRFPRYVVASVFFRISERGGWIRNPTTVQMLRMS